MEINTKVDYETINGREYKIAYTPFGKKYFEIIKPLKC